uniref:Uncharacterized protein n=1 Tax=Anguilla anguilla TaxID=7936 RepID=A0A0E9VQJ0_ANGAN
MHSIPDPSSMGTSSSTLPLFLHFLYLALVLSL